MSRPPEFDLWQKDLKAFMTSEEVTPPLRTSQVICGSVRRALNPPTASVLKKLLAVHIVAGLLSLLVCPQFGFGPIGGGHGLMGFVMGLGDWACATFCGAFFLGSTAAASLFALRPEEARVVYRAKLWQFPALTIFSFAALMTARGGSASLPALSYSLPWILGAMVAAVAVFEIGYRVMFRSVRAS